MPESLQTFQKYSEKTFFYIEAKQYVKNPVN